jgi:hypothetical protein
VPVTLKGGRRASFEVTLDGEVLHSKLTTGEWPDTEGLLAEIARRLGR